MNRPSSGYADCLPASPLQDPRPFHPSPGRDNQAGEVNDLCLRVTAPLSDAILMSMPFIDGEARSAVRLLRIRSVAHVP